MNQTPIKNTRILSVALSAKGLGYAVMEGQDVFIAHGHKIVEEGDKNVKSFAWVEKLIARYQPGVLVLQDVAAKDSRRAPRIKSLHRQIVRLAAKHKLTVKLISGIQMRSVLLGNPKGTKQEMAELLARKFPDELASRLPPKRKPWKSEDTRMDIFDAVALAVVFRLKSGRPKNTDQSDE
jgi:RNase H-fold protein (predicted Holliday junction resolvase)